MRMKDMITKFIDVTGKTEDEAVANALAQLGLDRDDVSVEILERAKKGFLGIGASPAKVRVTYEAAEEPKPAPAPVRPAEVRKPVPPRAPERSTEKPSPVEKAVPAAAVQEERKPERSEKKPPRPRSGRKPAPQQQAVEEAEAAAPAAAPVDLGEPCNDEKARQIITFLEGLLEHMGSTAKAKVYLDPEGRYKVILEGEKLGALIGRRGETLDAIQQLTNYSVNKSGEKRVRVHVDAENYRLKREESLQRLAQKMAAKAIKYRRNVTLDPMNAYERHVIHTALQDVAGVTTYSMGTDPNRRVIVAFDKTK